MCGIAGVYNYADPGLEADRELVLRMTRAMSHRGPDGEGSYADGPVALGHRRLAILDLSPAAAQPMISVSGRSCLVYNGEIYNHVDHRRRLASRGVRFRSTSDTETLLNVFEAEGVTCLRALAGIFGFAFWDRDQRVLTLVRDHVGVKQVYYYDDGRRILFASELKAILICPDVPREPDPEAINQYLHFHTPLFERTFFKHIRQIRPGEYLRITPAGMQFGTYWKVEKFEAMAGDPAAAVRDLRERLAVIVSQQLMSDVPVGAFFSGGIDSSAVAAFASKNGSLPECFGVHFTGQGVVDERPFQEAAARSLGVPLNLTTSDGSSFPEDLMRLMYFQDQPVIGPAMLPMHYVSRLAASKVKVCLGGQAADEIFGGYARYALTHPARVLGSWFTRRGAPPAAEGDSMSVGGNLIRQLQDRRNLSRILKAAREAGDWQERYFQHFAKISIATWRTLIADPVFFDRRQCRDVFRDTLRRSPATDPADKAMHWDMQTYLTGLFQQDDRMSMSVSLESRVPFADPRLVEFAFQTGFDLKFRSGSTKWLLRRAVSNVLPAAVLNRRKIGFDTPVEFWIRQTHMPFVREMLCSSRCRSRGIFDAAGVAKLLDHPEQPFWVDVVWKALCIEAWARTFLDVVPLAAAQPVCTRGAETSGYLVRAAGAGTTSVKHGPDPRKAGCTAEGTAFRIRNLAEEVREMGLRRTVARGVWELKQRSGLVQIADGRQNRPPGGTLAADAARAVCPIFAEPREVVETVGPRLFQEDAARLRAMATEATKGNILSFGAWMANYGMPIDWHRNPHNGRRWCPDRHWSKALADTGLVGDVKLTWEAARFPHAYLLARAAAFHPDSAPDYCAALTGQVRQFVAENPRGLGVHWSSGQELALRLIAWTFALNTFCRLGTAAEELNGLVQAYACAAGEHIAGHIEYARDLIPNNHLISEAVGVFLAGALGSSPQAQAWLDLGRTLLCDAAKKQFYPDGAYLQQSHNYHRSVLQLYLCAAAISKAVARRPEGLWIDVMERSLEFLIAHQNPVDGRLPNYGANDGSMPCVLSTCQFPDFRPVLQALSIACRGTRLYEPGPWDEEPAWLLGPDCLSLPLARPSRKSVSFAQTGYHVLRGRDDSTFGAFRCGTLPDRYSQSDMLHLDVWWRGENVLVDGGSYLYNGPEQWHRHFEAAASHNTVTVDGRDQMVHVRRFRNLYWTKAHLLDFKDEPDWVAAAGEHYGFRRYPGACVHRRSVFLARDDLWVVADRVTGSGRHDVRCHWLVGPFPYSFNAGSGMLSVETGAGEFNIVLLNGNGRPLPASVVSGQEDPPRGWLSRHYGEKIPAPSLVAESATGLPLQMVTILAGGSRPEISICGEVWTVRMPSRELMFTIDDGLVRPVGPSGEGTV